MIKETCKEGNGGGKFILLSIQYSFKILVVSVLHFKEPINYFICKTIQSNT